jgi:hypothetical protein
MNIDDRRRHPTSPRRLADPFVPAGGCCGGRGRRAFLADLGLGFTGLAMGAMLHREGVGSDAAWRLPDGMPHFRPRAKSVIWLFMNGGVSHIESFDPKPMVTKYGGKSITETPYADVLDPQKLSTERRVGAGAHDKRVTLYPLQVGFRRHGEAGVEVSDWFPHTARHVDRMAIVRSMWTTDNDHGAQGQFHTGRHMLDPTQPTLGGWVHYGLGSLNDNLPQFISIGDRPYWNRRDGDYLGPAHDAVPLRIDPAKPLEFGRPERPISDAEQRVAFGLVKSLDRLTGVEYPDDPATAARIASYELAYRMQTSVPNIVDFADETEETKRLYGIDLPHCREFGMQLLAARRFVERGVRFIQIQHGGGSAGAWDAHSAMKANHETNSRAVDQPIGGLLSDLERRGLLDETIVVFATEFGRTPGSQGADGRDHHPFAFSVWMAGGGVAGGVVHGATDELGYHAVENRHYVTDIHATILHLLGLDSRRLEVPGRKRLAIDHGSVIGDIIA